MKQGLDLTAVRKAWKLKLENRREDVEKELEKREKGPQVPYVSEKCPENFKALAERLVALQVKLGEFNREDISASDIDRIKDMKRRFTGLSFKDNIALMVENSGFVNYDTIFARHVIQVLDEFDVIYSRFYQEYGEIPMNVFSTDVRLFFKNNKNGLTKEEMLRVILEVYRPELANVKIENHNYDALPRSRQVIEPEEMERIVAELNSIAENGNIDVIFSSKYEAYFKELCARLKIAGYTFERFVSNHTSLDYTYCFKADVLPAVKQMIKSYQKKYGSTRKIDTLDPYLRYKCEVAQEVAGIYTMSGLVEHFGIDGDNLDQEKRTLSMDEIITREKILFTQLEKMYPDKVIPERFTVDNDRLYDELAMIANRRGFKNVNDYLVSKGFSRNITYKKKVDRSIYLSERDIINYGFLEGVEHVELAEQWLASQGITLADPYENLGVYRRLAYEKKDSSQKQGVRAVAKKQQGEE